MKTEKLTELVISVLVVGFVVFSIMIPYRAILPAAEAAPDSFVIRYCIHDNITTDLSHSYSWYLFIYSNGTASTELKQGATSQHVSTSQLSADLVTETYDVLTGEGLMSMSGWHNDTGWYNTVLNHTERVCLEISGTPHIVSFGGNSMMGIMPRSFALLNNILAAVNVDRSDLIEATLDLNVSERSPSDPIANISATFTNRGSTNLSDCSLCNTSWPTFVVSSNGTTVYDMQRSMMPLCCMDFGPNATEEFGPVPWNRTGVDAGEYVAMSCVVVWSWTYANISSDAPWLADSGSNTPTSPTGSPWLIAGVVGAVAVAGGASALYLVRVRGTGRKRA